MTTNSYRNHFPANDCTRPEMRNAYVRTRALYEKVFGQVDEKLWPKADDTCGDSYSGFIPSK